VNPYRRSYRRVVAVAAVLLSATPDWRLSSALYHKEPTLSPRSLTLHPLLPEALLKASKHGNSSTQDDEPVSLTATHRRRSLLIINPSLDLERAALHFNLGPYR
jgi:hypothetical protein